ncbi:uncharacterized protein LOC128224726 isoform X2 [Mya arenaria]|uniref:uncharacterized protein LOC128224726 isoform X2 n=2 Tax=Mya arenaria TaxID=6604 RepID=UPI0022DED9F4|nr:uncharacterized protein LOC128224726 isoform X2 [Mya arenaria]
MTLPNKEQGLHRIMLTQVDESAQSTRSIEATKRCIRITVIATRILAFLSIVFSTLAFVMVGIIFGFFMMATATFSVLSPLNFSCFCYRDCSRYTKIEKAIGHWSVYLWMFISNMCYAIMFGYSWYIWAELREYYYNDVHNYYFFNVDEYNSMALLDTVFAFTLIITFFLSMLNLYSFSLVYKYGCCFMNEVDRDHSQQSVETAVVMNKEISTIGGGLPVNGLQFIDTTVGSQQPSTYPETQ